MNKGKIILYTFVGICIAYGIAVIIFCLVNASSVISGIISIIPVLLFGGVFSAILIISAKGAWGSVLNKFGRKHEAKAYDAAVKNIDDENEKFKNIVKTHKYKKSASVKADKKSNKISISEEEYDSYLVDRRKYTIKRIFASILILIIGVALFFVFYSVNNSHIKKASNPNWIETTAKVEYVDVRDSDKQVLRFVYWVYNEETNINKGYIFDDTTITGVNYIEGRTITIYYSKHNPEITWQKSNSGMMISLAVICLSFAIIVAVLNLITSVEVARDIGVGGIFLTFAYGLIFAIAVTRGFNFIEMLLSGVAPYALIMFAFLGIYCIAYGIFVGIKRFYIWKIWRVNKKYEKV